MRSVQGTFVPAQMSPLRWSQEAASRNSQARNTINMKGKTLLSSWANFMLCVSGLFPLASLRLLVILCHTMSCHMITSHSVQSHSHPLSLSACVFSCVGRCLTGTEHGTTADMPALSITIADTSGRIRPNSQTES